MKLKSFNGKQRTLYRVSGGYQDGQTIIYFLPTGSNPES
jgi:hypothetical protein